MADTSLIVNNVSVRYRLTEEKVDNLKEYVIKLVKRDLRYKDFLALDDVSFELKKGDRLAVMGKNGAGKSTLMKVVAGVLKPSSGNVTCCGNVAPLLELGAGFDMQYSGAENIWLYGAMLGYSKAFIKSRYDEIVEFADLGAFINSPVKNYSSGMRARLGFALATVVEPDILILDEVLSVGDAAFKKKSEQKIMSMFDKGTTVLFVSHSETQVKNLCTKGILLDHGKIVFSGTAKETAEEYSKINGK
ncbi:MAG: ABC transporter ATP-binding protein [Lachnospiraceae bacterium]|nr:ABC transporter ATP-binding protein [Lachnospiraceae bacterium]